MQQHAVSRAAGVLLMLLRLSSCDCVLQPYRCIHDGIALITAVFLDL